MTLDVSDEPVVSGPALALGTPPRRTASVRRTSTIAMVWPDGFGTPLHLQGTARDLSTGADSTTRVLAEDTMTVVVDTGRVIEEIGSTPHRPRIAELVGTRGGGGLRGRLAEVLPDERANATRSTCCSTISPAPPSSPGSPGRSGAAT